MVEWLNAPGPYTSYTHEIDPKLSSIIQKFGFAFDDSFWYWHPRRHRRKRLDLNLDIIKRAPLWSYPDKSVPAEKAQRKKASCCKSQRKLEG